MTDDIIHKTCSKCKENLPTSEFYRDKCKRDGLHGTCKSCKKAYHEANREKIAEQKRAHYYANREYYASKNKKWMRDNREQRSQNRREWRKANREDISAYNRAWREANPNYEAEWRETNRDKCNAKQHRRRAKIAGNGGTLTAAEIKAIVAQDCFWCGTDCSQDFHLDHIVPLSKGGRNSRCNIAVSCPTCNLQKGAKDLSEWLREIGWRR